jgi:hypothetical protein
MTAVPSTIRYVPSRSVLQVSAGEAALCPSDVQASLLIRALEPEFLPGLMIAVDPIQTRCIGHVGECVDNPVPLSPKLPWPRRMGPRRRPS